MKVVVVYESMFGSTGTIGKAIAEGLREAADVRVGTVDDVSPDEVRDASLLVAGGPTHSRGMAKADARGSIAQGKAFAKFGPVLPGRESLAGWLERLPADDATVVTFDTRFDRAPWLTGSAAKEIARRLGGKGYTVVGQQSFFVRTTGGPLVDGERERAVAWGRELAASLVPSAA